MGVAAFSAIGAGAGVLGGQAGYSAASGKEYDSGEMVISSAIGGATGAVTGAVSGAASLSVAGASSRVIAETGTKVMLANSAINGAASVAQYDLVERYRGRTPAWTGRGYTFAAGVASSLLIDAGTGGGIASGAANRMAASRNPHYGLNVNGRPFGLTNLLAKDSFSQGFRSATADYISRYTYNRFERRVR